MNRTTRIDPMEISAQLIKELNVIHQKMEALDQLILAFQKAAKETFLNQDRNSNFPGENTLPETHESHNETVLPSSTTKTRGVA